MNVIIRLNGIDVTHHIISYVREQDLCSGVGTLNLEAVPSLGVPIPYSIITVTEEGTLRGTFYVSTTSQSNSQINIVCQDASKKLSDYFIYNTYDVKKGDYAKYWIIRILTEATIDYAFAVSGNGGQLTENTTIGSTPASEIINNLLSISGWYIYFDVNNVCRISKTEINTFSPQEYFTDATITSVNTKTDSSNLRNKVIVWGNGNPYTGTWVKTSMSKKTGYETNPKDERTIVVSNSTIYDFAQASSVARQVLNEFSEIEYSKTIEIAGNINCHVGNTVYVASSAYTGYGYVYRVSVRVSSSGFVSTLTLDTKCPRIVGFFGTDTEYVYVGTEENGIWRKLIRDGYTWSNYSDGLLELNIHNLAIYYGLFACIADRFMYYRTKETYWTKLHPGDFTNTTSAGKTTYTEDEVICTGICIDKTEALIYSTFASFVDNISWVVTSTVNGGIKNKVQILNSNGDNYRAFDVDMFYGKKIITGLNSGSQAPSSGGNIDMSPYTVFTRNGKTDPFKFNMFTGTQIYSWMPVEPVEQDNYIFWITRDSSAKITIHRYDMSTHEVIHSNNTYQMSGVNSELLDIYVENTDSILFAYRNSGTGGSYYRRLRYIYSTDTITVLNTMDGSLLNSCSRTGNHAVILNYADKMLSYYDVRDNSYGEISYTNADLTSLGSLNLNPVVMDSNLILWTCVSRYVTSTSVQWWCNTLLFDTTTKTIILDDKFDLYGPAIKTAVGSSQQGAFGATYNQITGEYSVFCNVRLTDGANSFNKNFKLSYNNLFFPTLTEMTLSVGSSYGKIGDYTLHPYLQNDPAAYDVFFAQDFGIDSGVDLEGHYYKLSTEASRPSSMNVTKVDYKTSEVLNIRKDIVNNKLYLEILDYNLQLIETIPLYDTWTYTKNYIYAARAKSNVLYIYNHEKQTAPNPDIITFDAFHFGSSASGSAYETLRESSEGNYYETVDILGGPAILENSQESPVMVVPYPLSGYMMDGILWSGHPPSGYASSGSINSAFRFSFYSTYGTYFSISGEALNSLTHSGLTISAILDARTFYITPGGYPEAYSVKAVGEDDDAEFLGVVTQDKFMFTRLRGSGIGEAFENIDASVIGATLVETTNRDDIPYIFITTTDPANKFLQRDNDSTVFTPRILSFPPSTPTVIRVDDRI